MTGKVYPDLQRICRLCLKENEGTICIFPKEKSSSDKYSALSIPMRIMACASLEVKEYDDFPKNICTDCRLELEKSYYFRKMSQLSDSKLKKHLRMVSMGKISKVFTRKLDTDDDDEDQNELEFKDSLEFIQEQESKKKLEEDRKIEEKVKNIRLELERELEVTKETFRTKCHEEIVPLIEEEIRKELKITVRNELEESLRKSIMDQCLIEAKNLVRNEVREECRQSEMKYLLDDLQTYLTNKKRGSELNSIKISNQTATNSNKKQQEEAEANSKIEYEVMEIINQREETEDASTPFVAEEINLNDEECDSDGNFLAYDTDEGFEIPKKISDTTEEHPANNDGADVDYEDEEIENNVSYTKVTTAEFMDNNEESQDTTTTSYRIDNESGEIQFLKKTDNFTADLDEANMDQSSYENVMIIKLPDNMDGGGVIEKIEVEKYPTPNKQLLIKSDKSPEKKLKPIVTSSISRTKTTTVEATVLTKTYVNPLQRSTDTPKIFRCNSCPMVFSTKQSLDRHLRTHEKVERLGVTFQCPECRIVVSCSSALRRHMYTHYEEKPFSCNLCEKSFVQKEILKRHMQTHTGIKPHQCPHCEKAFAQRINLTQHINRHHLEEPRIRQHSCHLCPKRFNHASGLSRHLATHGGVAFQCSECDRTFGDRSSIKRHIATLHSNTKASKSQNKSKCET